jgi:arylsulfatase B
MRLAFVKRILGCQWFGLLVCALLSACGGDSGGSGSSSGGTTTTAPGAPTIGAATAGDASASIAFTAPASNGGAAITAYNASCTSGSATVGGSGTASPITVSGLTNGTAYSCTVTATNSAGASTPSAAIAVTPVGAVASTTPNILFVIADDFGLDASPCHPTIGTLKPNMPNLSALCSSGVVFDRAWTHPTCTPTRASLLTGKYGVHTNVMAVDEVLTDTDTILTRLQQGTNPYAVAVIGKWHVSGASPAANAPAGFGAQYYSGFLTGALADYFNWRITENGVASNTTTYSTTLLTDKAISWVAAQQKPWFLWLAYNAPHTPFHTPPANLYTQPGLKNGTATDNRTKYFAAAEALDTELGRLLASIPAATRANTVVVFLGDNGTPGQVIQSPYSNTKAKDSLYQGGINVPLVVSGAGVTRTGQREQALVNGADLFATFAALAKRSTNIPTDSVSFASALTSASFSGRTHAYIDFRDGTAVATATRDTRYKLVEFGNGSRELFDLTNDPYETQNLLAAGTTPTLDAIIQGLVAQRTAFQR